MAWGGLGFPMLLTEAQQLAVKGKPHLPAGSSEALAKFLVFFEGEFAKFLDNHGYDPAKHFSLFSSHLRYSLDGRLM